MTQGAAYRPDIDGLRAVAVLSVLFFHAGLPPFSGGFVGVDVFFVISGYLITGILAGDIRKDAFSLSRFYERRVRRIFPALAFTIAITIAGAIALFSAVERERFYESLGWLAIFASNVYFMNNSGYFDAAAEDNAILQTWSLAIEEQFYVVFPLLLFALSRQSRVSVKSVLMTLAVASFIYGVFIVDRDARTAFFSTPGRAWELLLGALIAVGVFPQARSENLRTAVAVVGAAMVLGSLVLLSNNAPFPGALALPACAGTAAMIWAHTGGPTLVSRALSARPMVFVGLISYSLYLLHWPLLTFARYAKQDDLSLVEALLALAAAFALAAFSWRFIETPFRRPAKPAPNRAVLAIAASLMAVLAVGGFAASSVQSGSHSAADKLTEQERQRMLAEPCMLRDTQTFDAWPEAACTRAGQGGTVALWGDSFAAHYFDAFRAWAERTNRPLVLLAESSCPPIAGLPVPNRPGCERFNTGALGKLVALRPAVVVVSADWMIYEKKKTIDESFVDKYELLTATLEKLKQAGSRVIVMGPSPVFGAPVPRIAAGTQEDQAKASVSRRFDDFFRRLQTQGAIEYVPTHASFCTTAMYCRFREGGDLLFWDSGHLTAKGSARVLAAMVPHLESK